MEFFNTEADLGTFSFLFFKKFMELCKHSAGGMSFKITGLSLQKHTTTKLIPHKFEISKQCCPGSLSFPLLRGKVHARLTSKSIQNAKIIGNIMDVAEPKNHNGSTQTIFSPIRKMVKKKLDNISSSMTRIRWLGSSNRCYQATDPQRVPMTWMF